MSKNLCWLCCGSRGSEAHGAIIAVSQRRDYVKSASVRLGGFSSTGNYGEADEIFVGWPGYRGRAEVDYRSAPHWITNGTNSNSQRRCRRCNSGEGVENGVWEGQMMKIDDEIAHFTVHWKTRELVLSTAPNTWDNTDKDSKNRKWSH